jgi:hypothetical protein
MPLQSLQALMGVRRRRLGRLPGMFAFRERVGAFAGPETRAIGPLLGKLARFMGPGNFGRGGVGDATRFRDSLAGPEFLRRCAVLQSAHTLISSALGRGLGARPECRCEVGNLGRNRFLRGRSDAFRQLEPERLQVFMNGRARSAGKPPGHGFDARRLPFGDEREGRSVHVRFSEVCHCSP